MVVVVFFGCGAVVPVVTAAAVFLRRKRSLLFWFAFVLFSAEIPVFNSV